MSDDTGFLIYAEIGDREYEFETDPGTNLLGAGLRHKVPIDHICRVGLCGTCQVLIAHGKDNLSGPSESERLLLDEVPLAQGVRLSCQAKVMGEVVIRQPKRKR